MEIFSGDVFRKVLDVEIAKTERYGYDFSILAVGVGNQYREDKNAKVKNKIEKIVNAEVRKSDVIGVSDDGIYLVLLNNTNKVNAEVYLKRVIKKAVVEEGISIRTSIESYKENDEAIDLMLRLYMKLRWGKHNAYLIFFQL